MRRPPLVLALAVGTVGAAGAVGAAAAFVGCSAAPDFTPFACAVPLDDDTDAGDGGDGGDGGDATLATDAAPVTTGVPGDAGADADAATTAYFYARQITPEICTLASISWIQCADGIYARYYALNTVDGGALTIDYYQAATGALVAHVIYPSVSSAGQCTYGPRAFTPPACGGSQVVCCPLNADAGDAGADAAPDSGCGF